MGGKNEKIVQKYEVTQDTKVVVGVVEYTDFWRKFRAILGPTRRENIPYRVHKRLESPVTVELRDHQRLKVL